MITLKKERSYVKVETWDEITELNGFQKKLNYKDHELDEIIGRYIFSEKTHAVLLVVTSHIIEGILFLQKMDLLQTLVKTVEKHILMLTSIKWQKHLMQQ